MTTSRHIGHGYDGQRNVHPRGASDLAARPADSCGLLLPSWATMLVPSPLPCKKDTVARADVGGRREVREDGTITNTMATFHKVASTLAHGKRELRFGYEAGPCGYSAQLSSGEHEWVVVAPSLISRLRHALAAASSSTAINVSPGPRLSLPRPIDGNTTTPALASD